MTIFSMNRALLLQMLSMYRCYRAIWIPRNIGLHRRSGTLYLGIWLNLWLLIWSVFDFFGYTVISRSTNVTYLTLSLVLSSRAAPI